MGQVDLEATSASERLDRRRRLVRPDLPAAAAALAVQMPVLVGWADVELLSAVEAVGVADEPDILEDPERPVDGRRCRPGIDRATALDEVAAGHVARGLVEDLEDQPSLGRPAHPRPAEVLPHIGKAGIRRRSAADHRTKYRRGAAPATSCDKTEPPL